MQSDGQSTMRARDPMLGRTLDRRYRITSRIARGGMASVYAATDIRLDREVAVKVMHDELARDEAFTDRFVTEARSAAKLSHPNVVAVYDQGEDDGTVYLVMEMVTGRTLRELINDEAPLKPVRAVALMEAVLAALAAAHRAGLIHRDMKPENVLIADDGRVKVVDFGLAKAVSAHTQHTATKGVLIGTVSYLAPELVVEGRSDARADVYATGVMLYELLTGERPHEGETPIQVAYRHVHHDVPPPSRLVSGIPEYLDALVARATVRDPSLRQADAGVFSHQLRRVAHALNNGVRDDPELTQDLIPPHPAYDRFAEVEEPGSEESTAPEVWDTDDLSWLRDPAPAGRADDHQYTQRFPAQLPPPPTPPTGQPGQPGQTPPPEPPDAYRRGVGDGADDPDDYDADDYPGQDPPRRRRGLPALLLALLLVVALGLGTYWFGWARYTSTPGVVGMTVAKAEARLDEAGLGLDEGTEEFSESVPPGEVIRTEPKAGDRVLKDGEVTVIVSKGPERYKVPDLAGRTEDEAQDALAEHFTFEKSIERFSETVPSGRVITTDPKPGTVSRPDASVSLILSKGRQPIKVGGDWVGTDIDEMTSTLTDRGLKVEVTEEIFSDDVPEGEVVSYSPDGGTLFKGETVSVVVSKGPELFEVPDVSRSTTSSAEQELEDAGFEVTIERSLEYIDLGIAVRTDPRAGEMVPKGTEITLYVI